ncbi:hypothetical protein FQR65_LT03351 [Abscondita terminalis]|nr:hypothetical protein FQR65_LT03351 [Abscondita terminalis]
MVKDISDKGSFLGFSELTEKKLWKQLLAEFVGTLILVYIGCGSASGQNSNVEIGLCFGLIVATMAQCIGHVSGCHINPAVTVGLLISGHMKLAKSILYIVVQCIGAVAGAGILRILLPDDGLDEHTYGLGETSYSDDLGDYRAIFIELILTFPLVLVVLALNDPKTDTQGSPAVAVGFAVTASHLCGIQFTGSSINPARTLGPAVVALAFTQHWVYWLGPLLGAVLAGLLYRFAFSAGEEEASYDF